MLVLLAAQDACDFGYEASSRIKRLPLAPEPPVRQLCLGLGRA